ncbi:MAG: spore germination protein GerW family protein [Anaerolineae bacterium]|jgi:uncharacterized spore protein YtfJ
MEADVQKLLDTLADLREKANVNACFGEPVTVEGRTIIPVARIGYGFGIGVGQGPTGEAEEGTVEKMDAGGGGGGMAVSPLGVIEVTSKGLRVEPTIDRQRVAMASLLVAAWSAFCLARALAVIFRRREQSERIV